MDELWAKYLQKLANEYDVNLEILNLVDDDVLVKMYNQAKLVVYAPYLEPFGLVPLEAMACGTPIGAVKEGGMRETVIHNETGLLTEREESSFADAVGRLLLDNKKIDEMSKKSIEYVQLFWTVEHAGKRIEAHLKNVFQKELTMIYVMIK
jgi:glycosyltransferase involved in cell wall biosynthesis